MGDVFEENCNLSLELEQHEFSLVLFNSTPFVVLAILWLPEFTEIADNQTIISYPMSREWDSNPRPFRYE